MTSSAAARPDAIRRHNLALVLDHIHRDGALTRAQLTQRLAVSRSTMGALVADLMELGLVEELVPSGGSGVGRPSHVVGPHAAGPYVVAVDVDVTQVITAAVGIGGTMLARTVVDTGVDVSTPENVADVVAESLREVSAETGRALYPLGVGVSVPGTVDRFTGHVAVAPNLEWHDVAFGDILARRLPAAMTVAVANDADLAVLAEHRRGRARGIDDVVFLLGRVGIGAGIIANGRPLHGHDGYAGEIGHNVVDANGPACHCGKHGCVETYVGEGALLRLAGRSQPPTDEATAAVFADARRGDEAALGAVRQVAESLGRAIASLVNTLNPQCVMLGGYLSELLDIGRAEVELALKEFALEAPGREVALIGPTFGADTALLGAAELAYAELLADPLTVAGALQQATP
jgi:predicted NBD/HSP70 family sugar kinase